MDTIRMMTTCMATAQAAGLAASLALGGGLPALTGVRYSALRRPGGAGLPGEPE